MPLSELELEREEGRGPIGEGGMGTGGQSILDPSAFTGGQPIGPASIFNIMGAPIAVLGGVFEAGFPIGGPVAQIFRGGSAPVTPELFLATLSPSGPIGAFFIGSEGAPIGEETFGGGAQPIQPDQPAAGPIGTAILQPVSGN